MILPRLTLDSNGGGGLNRRAKHPCILLGDGSRQEYRSALEEHEVEGRSDEKARTQTEENHARQQAVAAQSQMEQTRREVEQSAGQHYAADLYHRAMDANHRGEQRLGEQQWQQAEEEFGRARDLFIQLLQGLPQEQPQQITATVRENALQVQQEAMLWARLCPELFTEASDCLAQADQMFAREEFSAALAGFTQSIDLFHQVQQEAALRRQKEQTEEMQARARKLQQKFRSAKSWQKKSAEQALAEGDQFLQHGKYREAWEKYQEAVADFVAVQREQTSRRELLPNTRKSPTLHSSHSLNVRTFLGFIFQWRVGLPLLVGLGAVVITETYFVDRFNTPDSSDLQVSAAKELSLQDNSIASSAPSPARNGQEPSAGSSVEPTTQPIIPPSPLLPSTRPFSDMQEQEPPAPPVPALHITQAAPDPVTALNITPGQSVDFAVEAQGGQGEALRYVWLLDGQEKATGKTWTYQPDPTITGDIPQQVTAVVTDESNQRVETTWQVLITKQTSAINKGGPRFTSVSPSTDPIEIPPGKSASFSVMAKDPDLDDHLVYIWTLNGQEVARGDNHRQFRSPPATAPYAVAVTVVDQAGQTDHMDWRVTIDTPSSGLRLVSLQPQDGKVSVRTGQPLDFSVTAELPEGTQKQLRYQWNLEGEPTTTTEIGSFHFVRDIPGIYRLTVFVTDSEGLQSPPKRWIVEVQPQVEG
jgi:flagellin-specific chaperone FliS